MTILYSNGCSYTTNTLVTPEKRYPFLVAQSLDWELISAGISGSCNSRIIRCSMRDLIELRRDHPDRHIVALIQLTHLSRFEYAGTPTDKNNWMYAKNDYFQSIKLADDNNWPSEAVDWIKQTTILYNPQATLDQLLASTVGMVSLFETLNIDYRVYAGPGLSDEIIWPNNNIFDAYLKTKSNVLDLEKFSMLSDLVGSYDHPDSVGMQKIADYFITQLGALE